MRNWRAIAAATATAVVGLAGPAAAQCSMCGTALQGDSDPLARGVFWSVVFLISLPYTIVGGFIVAIIVASRRAKRALPESRPAAVAHLHLVPKKESPS